MSISMPMSMAKYVCGSVSSCVPACSIGSGHLCMCIRDLVGIRIVMCVHLCIAAPGMYTGSFSTALLYLFEVFP